jgi:hypothetical protein
MKTAFAASVIAKAAATAGGPASFDCAMRKLAYTYGKQLIPRQGEFESLYYALNLNDPDCLGEMKADSPIQLGISSQVASDAIYVDAEAGQDSNTGTEEAPMKTVAAAVAKAPRGNVVLRAGTHFFESTLQLSSENSGLTISAYPGEKPVVSGGKKLDVSWEEYDTPSHDVTWKIFENTNVVRGGHPDEKTIRDLGKQQDAQSCQDACEADLDCISFTWHDTTVDERYRNDCWGRLDSEFSESQEGGHTSGRSNRVPGEQKNIWKTDIAGQVTEVPGLQLDGKRATRARYPNLPAGIEVTPGRGYMVGQNDAVWVPPDFGKYGNVTYYTDNQESHLRNNTPGGLYQHYQIGVGGLCSVYDPPVGYWCSDGVRGGGAFAFRTPSGVTPNVSALPNSPYKDPSEMIINVWRPKRWANWMFEVEKFDASTNTYTFGKGGNQGARGNDQGGDWFVENVFEELDHTGEFFFDSKASELYLFHNGTGAPPAETEVIVPQIRTLINISGTQWDPVQDLTIDGLVFKSARYTYMDPHGVPSAGDWALDRNGALFLQGTENLKVQNSVFERLDGNGVMISGYNRNATVQDSDFSYIGGNAIVAWGYTNETENSGFPYYTPNTNYPEAGVDGTDGNHPRYTKIMRNTAREVGLYEKQSSFYMQAKTSETTIQENVFFNGPRAGINFNDGFGGGDDLSHNLVFSTCRESGDHGPFNSWDRQPYLTTVRTGEPSMTMAWRELHHNFFIDNYSPQENVDNDDGSEYYHTHENFLVYGNNGEKTDFGGHDNHHFGNIYAYAGKALAVTGTLEGHESYFYGNKVVLTGYDIGSPQCSAPQTQMHDNQYFSNNQSLTMCKTTWADAQSEGMDKGSTVSAIPTDETILGWATELLQIKTNAELVI